MKKRKRYNVPSRNGWSWDEVCPWTGRRGVMPVSSWLTLIARLPIPLRGLAACAACHECFELGPDTCPNCGGEQVRSLVEMLEHRVLDISLLN
jgi:hypothetical protein